MQIKQNLVSSSKYSIKCPYIMTPKYVTVHNTDNPNAAPAKNEVNYMISNNNQVSFHVAVDDVEAIQGIPFNRNAWAAGDGASGNGNRNSIHVEICKNKLGAGSPIFKKAEANAVEVCAQILKQFNLGIDRLKAHRDWSGKNCPSTTNFADFKARVKKVLEGSTSVTQSNNNSTYTVKVTTDVLNVRSGPGISYKITTQVKKNEVYTIVETKGNWGKLKSGAGWICLDYTNKNSNLTLKVGSKVKIIGSNYATGQTIPNWVKNNTYTVSKINEDKALIKEITSWVYIKDLKLI